MERRLVIALGATGALGGCAAARPDRGRSPASLRAAESAFAATMAARDLAGFARFVAVDAVFINGGKPLRGRAAIVEHWRRFYERPQAPFAWRPELVEVLDSGTLGYSEGPVTAADGSVVARYYSTWRVDAAGEWKVVFDNGYDVCGCPKA